MCYRGCFESQLNAREEDKFEMTRLYGCGLASVRRAVASSLHVVRFVGALRQACSSGAWPSNGVRSAFRKLLVAAHLRTGGTVRPHEWASLGEYCCGGGGAGDGGMRNLRLPPYEFRAGERSIVRFLWQSKPGVFKRLQFSRDVDRVQAGLELAFFRIFGVPSTDQIQKLRMTTVIDSHLDSFLGRKAASKFRQVGVQMLEAVKVHFQLANTTSSTSSTGVVSAAGYQELLCDSPAAGVSSVAVAAAMSHTVRVHNSEHYLRLAKSGGQNVYRCLRQHVLGLAPSVELPPVDVADHDRCIVRGAMHRLAWRFELVGVRVVREVVGVLRRFLTDHEYRDTLRAVQTSLSPNPRVSVVLPCGSRKTLVIVAMVLAARKVRAASPSGRPRMLLVTLPTLAAMRGMGLGYWFNDAMGLVGESPIVYEIFRHRLGARGQLPSDATEVLFIAGESFTDVLLEWLQATDNSMRFSGVVDDESHSWMLNWGHRRAGIRGFSRLFTDVSWGPGFLTRTMTGTLPPWSLPVLCRFRPYSLIRPPGSTVKPTYVTPSRAGWSVKDRAELRVWHLTSGGDGMRRCRFDAGAVQLFRDIYSRCRNTASERKSMVRHHVEAVREILCERGVLGSAGAREGTAIVFVLARNDAQALAEGLQTVLGGDSADLAVCLAMGGHDHQRQHVETFCKGGCDERGRPYVVLVATSCVAESINPVGCNCVISIGGRHFLLTLQEINRAGRMGRSRIFHDLIMDGRAYSFGGVRVLTGDRTPVPVSADNGQLAFFYDQRQEAGELTSRERDMFLDCVGVDSMLRYAASRCRLLHAYRVLEGELDGRHCCRGFCDTCPNSKRRGLGVDRDAHAQTRVVSESGSSGGTGAGACVVDKAVVDFDACMRKALAVTCVDVDATGCARGGTVGTSTVSESRSSVNAVDPIAADGVFSAATQFQFSTAGELHVRRAIRAFVNDRAAKQSERQAERVLASFFCWIRTGIVDGGRCVFCPRLDCHGAGAMCQRGRPAGFLGCNMCDLDRGEHMKPDTFNNFRLCSEVGGLDLCGTCFLPLATACAVERLVAVPDSCETSIFGGSDEKKHFNRCRRMYRRGRPALDDYGGVLSDKQLAFYRDEPVRGFVLKVLRAVGAHPASFFSREALLKGERMKMLVLATESDWKNSGVMSGPFSLSETSITRIKKCFQRFELIENSM